MPAPLHRPMTLHEWGLLITLSLLWGSSFFFNGVAVRELPTFTIVTVRVTLAAIILLIALKATGTGVPQSRRLWLAFLGMGLLSNVLPFSLIVWAQAHIASGIASILNATTPLFTVILAHVLTADEKMTAPRLLGAATGFAGVAIMIGGEALASLGVDVLAQSLCLAAALSYAFASVFGRQFKAMGVLPLATAAGQTIASSLLLLPAMLLIDKPWTLPAPSLATILALASLAIFSTALAFLLYFRLLATAGATNLVLVGFLVPVSAILSSVFILGEALLPRQLAGFALIGVALAAIDGRPWQSLKSTLSPADASR